MPGKNEISSLNELMLLEVQHYGPVTAVKFYKDHLLVGYGPTFKVFQIDLVTNKISLISSQRAFKRNKIHCIGVLQGKISLAGGRSFAVVDFSRESLEIHEKAINEWIIACEFYDDETLLILTSHNEVLKVNIQDLNSFKFSVSDKLHCNEKSLLYSGSIRITDSNKIYVAAGTVMSGIIIWDLETKEIVHELTAHEGSIFGVKISQDGNYVISCSDDRSVKLSDFKTGQVLATGWGHGSRIWSLEFVAISVSAVDIFSTGEDCSARLWHYERGSDSLTQAYLWDHCHLGKHIWSGDVDSATLEVAATGGADGKLRVHDLSALNNGLSRYSPQDITSITGVEFEKKEVIKQFADLSQCDLLVTVTSMGKIFTLQKVSGAWTRINLSEDEASLIKASGMLHGFPLINSAAIFTKLGDLLTLTFDLNGHLKKHDWIMQESDPSRKIFNVLVGEDSEKREYYALLDCPNPNVPFQVKTFALKNDSLTVVKSIELSKPNSMAFTPTSLHFDVKNLWLLVGSRHANFAVYNLIGQNYLLPLLARKVCPGDTITSIKTVQSSENQLVALLTVRDGTYLYMSIGLKHETTGVMDEKFAFDIILQNKLSRGILEGGFVQNGELLIYGFQSSAFYIWNETKQIEIAHHVCGGAHRQWELIKCQGKFNYKFVYLNKSGLIVKGFQCRFETSEDGLLVGGTHGREIRGVAISPVLEQDGTKLVATASEDAAVKLGKLDSTGNIKYLWTMNNHVSGLQNISFMNHLYIASSAANEELLIWRLNRISNFGVTIVEHSRLKTSEENPDLRIMDFASIEVEGGFWIAAVYSNSKIKVFFYNSKEKTFSLCIHDTYSTFCILNVNFMTRDDKIYLMTGTTDGFITIWDITLCLSTGEVSKLNNLVVLQQLHQSGIKAIAIIPGVDEWKIVTGGDDNALVLSKLVSTEHRISLETVSFIEDAASATITDISNVGTNRVLATSVDQVVRLWNISEDSLRCESANYTTVSDTGCCDTTEFNGHNFGLVGGAGLGVWSLNN